jgi:hypothetical protein
MFNVSSSSSLAMLFFGSGDGDDAITESNSGTEPWRDADSEQAKELLSTKHLLKERTTQLKILMETLDTLHTAGTKSRSDDNVLGNNWQGQGGGGGSEALAGSELSAGLND